MQQLCGALRMRLRAGSDAEKATRDAEVPAKWALPGHTVLMRAVVMCAVSMCAGERGSS